MKRAYDIYTKRFENKAHILSLVEKNGIPEPDPETGISRCSHENRKCHYRVTLTIEEVRPAYQDGVFVGEELS